MRRLLYILFLFAASGAAAQQMPERQQVRKGNRAYDRGDYQTSIERYSRALELAPGSFEAAYDLGNALYKAEMFDRAEQTMTRAAADTLRTAQERARACNNLGNARFKQQKYKEALESYRQALRFDPSDMEIKYNYAYTKKLLDDRQQNGGGQNQNQNQNRNQGQNGQQERQDGGQDQNKDQNQDRDNPQQDGQEASPDEPQQEPGEENSEDSADPRDGSGQSVPSEISEQEQQQMLDAIQAQEDRTQEKLKERQGTIVRGGKNW